MDYDDARLLDSSINGNINTGNISTDDFLAVFTTTATTTNTLKTTVLGAAAAANATAQNATTSTSTSTATLLHAAATATATAAANASTGVTLEAPATYASNVTLKPPLLTIDGQFTLANILESSLAGGSAATTSSPALLQSAYANDSYYFLSGGNFGGIGGLFNGSLNFGSNYYNQTLGNISGLGNVSGGAAAAAAAAGNVTEVHWDGRYPSGYTLTHIVIASIIVTILMIIIVVGNMLVIIAIATEKSLKNIQNWFIASLAVADFFLGLIIMPFSLANELMGYWIFGSWWCDVHSAMDVLLCTASIMNLCLISLDRYWSITKAVDYLKSRTPARAAVMITAVWIMSALICIPPLLGWKVKMPEDGLPKCELSNDIGYVLYSALGSFYIPSCIMVFVYIRIYFAAKARARRGIKKHPRKTNNEQVTSFTTANKKGTIPMPSSSSAALQMHQQRQIATIETPPNNAAMPMQIPTVTMDLASDISTSEAGDMDAQTLAYANNANNSNNVMPMPMAMATATATTTTTIITIPTATTNATMLTNAMAGSPNCKETLKVSTIATGRVGLNVPVPPSMAAADTINNAATNNNNNGSIVNNALSPTAATATAPSMGAAAAAAAAATATTPAAATTVATLMPPGGMSPSAGTTLSVTTTTMATPNELRVSPIAGRCRALSVGIDTDMVSEFDPSSSDSGVRRNESKAVAATAAATNVAAQPKSPKSIEVIKAELEPAIPKTPKPRDPEKEKRRIARKKEKRATLILGLIMGSFIACWLPFFFLYILVPACRSHCHIPESAFAIAFWLGYMNSALNPAIYTIFNKDFRRAFRRILFK